MHLCVCIGLRTGIISLYIINRLVLGAFAGLRKATIRLVMSVRLPVCLLVQIEQLGYYWTDFLEI